MDSKVSPCFTTSSMVPAFINTPSLIIAIFFSTHVLDVAEKLCNKVAMIKDGVLIKAGTMEEVVKQGETLESIFMEVACDDKAD